MKAVRSKGSKIELLLMKALWKRGYRYRKNYMGVTGKPDLVFLKLKVAVFCDSEFWHGKDWEARKHSIHTNKEFWHSKIEKNIERDRFVNNELLSKGWTVVRFWGKEIEKNLDQCVVTIAL